MPHPLADAGSVGNISLETIFPQTALLIGRNTEGDAGPWTGATPNDRRAF
jgi:hypothetical protein